MPRILVPLFFIVFACLLVNIEGTENQLVPEHVSSRVDGRIVNGSKADAAQFPHMVSLRRAWTSSHFCGGSIIAEKWILTAAHCMFNKYNELIKPSTFHVVVGGVKLDDKDIAPRQKSNIEALFVHPKFDDTSLVNDAALLLLKEPLLFHTEYVQPIPLADFTPEAGSLCSAAGWGYLIQDRKIVSNDLMYVELPLLRQTTCKKLLSQLTPMGEGQICAGYLEGQRDACQGDSGGPLTCNGTLVGIVSGGYGCALPNFPGFYTEIAYYRDWIDQVQNTTGSCCWYHDCIDQVQNTTDSCCFCASDKSLGKSSGRSSTFVASAPLMATVFIYSLRSLYGIF